MKVYATTVHRGDSRIRSFTVHGGAWQRFLMRVMLGFRGPRKKVLGMELSREIESVGINVTRFREGYPVFASTEMSFGAYAEYVYLPKDGIVPLKPLLLNPVNQLSARAQNLEKLISQLSRSCYFMELLLFLFKSGLSDEDVMAIDDDRAEKYLRVKGLILKFYVQDEQSNHIGGVFVFDSKENLKSFRDSMLSQSTSKAYKFIEPPMIQVFEIKRALITNTAMTFHE